MKKNWFNREKLDHLSSFLLIGLLTFVLVRQGPSILERFRYQGKSLSFKGDVQELSGQRLPFPFKGHHVLVFWATWCGPCKVEMNRLKNLVDKGEISGEQIHAISIGETLEKVITFQKENSYPFHLYVDPQYQVSEPLKIEGTPTLILVGPDAKVEWWTSGLSPSLEWRVKRHLNGSKPN